MYDQDQFNNGQFDRESGAYHYSFVPPMSEPPVNQTPDPVPPQPPQKKKGFAGKAVALVLCCALVGGGAGVGGAAAYSALAARQDPGNETVIYRNETNPAPVKVVQADGLTPMSLSEIYASYADACVCVTVETIVQNGWYQQPATGAGSGFIISNDGYIVTNYHVIDGASSIKVTLNNGETYDAKLVGGEELNDVAVLKLDGVSGLKTVVLGDSDDVVVGETVCTIGNALGTLSFSQTSGAVSATGRSVTMTDGTVMNMIQTDCTINSGNSGGPLFDSYGRVVGITSAKLSNNGQSSQAAIEGIGFAIPINDVIGIVTDYMKFGYVTGRPYMGILEPRDISDYAQTFGWPNGVYVTGIDEGSCAEKAGLKPGDIITKIDDTEITGVNQMVSVKNSYRAGDTVTLEVYRSGGTLTLTLTFDEQTNNTTQSSGNQGQQPQDPNPQPTMSGGNDRNELPYGYGDGDSNNGYYDYYDPFSSFPWSYFFGR